MTVYCAVKCIYNNFDILYEICVHNLCFCGCKSGCISLGNISCRLLIKHFDDDDDDDDDDVRWSKHVGNITMHDFLHVLLSAHSEMQNQFKILCKM